MCNTINEQYRSNVQYRNNGQCHADHPYRELQKSDNSQADLFYLQAFCGNGALSR